MGSRFEVRLRKVESQVTGLLLDAPPRMSLEESYEFVQNLVAEIDAGGRGVLADTCYHDQFRGLSDLNQQGVRNLMVGLCRFGLLPPVNESRLPEFLAAVNWQE